jgi:hypothetical protein
VGDEFGIIHFTQYLRVYMQAVNLSQGMHGGESLRRFFELILCLIMTYERSGVPARMNAVLNAY